MKFNHIIRQHLSFFVPKHQQDWNELILFFLLAYMTIIHKTTGNISSTMVYGRELRLPYDLLFGKPEQSGVSVTMYQAYTKGWRKCSNSPEAVGSWLLNEWKTDTDAKPMEKRFKEGELV